ncbi:MAG: hypothetical protein IJ359_01105 [Erysipelotrichaceae bacterium]|nr:hypothetical protein [Erysipelotrichaceae bacterium]
MKYLDQIENVLNIIKFESIRERLSHHNFDNLDEIIEEVCNSEDYFEQLHIIYTELGVEYLYTVFGANVEQNPFMAYQLGEFYYNYRLEIEKEGMQKLYNDCATDCLYYAYKNGVEDAYDLLITCLLFYCKSRIQYYIRIDYKEIFKLMDLLQSIIKIEDNTAHKLLLTKRIGDCHYDYATILNNAISHDNWKSTLELHRSYMNAIKACHFDVLKKIKEMYEWSSMDRIKSRRELDYKIYEHAKIEYQFIEDECCNEIVKYFNSENYQECDIAYGDLLYLNNKNVLYNYAIFLKHGYHEKNLEDALSYFKKAYDLGVIEAIYHIADITNDINYANIAIEHNLLAAYQILIRNTEDYSSIQDEYYSKLLKKYDN